MKIYLYKLLSVLLVAMMFLSSCSEEEEIIGINPDSLYIGLNSDQSNVALTKSDQDKEVLTVSWYFNQESNFSNVNYILQIDNTLKNSFIDAHEITIGNDLSKLFTGGEISEIILLSFDGIPGIREEINFRIKAELGDNTVYSNILPVSVTPMNPFAPENLTLSGDGISPNSVVSDYVDFEPVDYKSFVTVIRLSPGGSYTFASDDGVSYGFEAGDSETGEFRPGNDRGIPTPDEEELYMVEVDFVNQTYNVTKFENDVPDELFMIGSLTDDMSWEDGSNYQMVKINDYIFTIDMANSRGSGEAYIFDGPTGGKSFSITQPDGTKREEGEIQNWQARGLRTNLKGAVRLTLNFRSMRFLFEEI